jgi:predicted nuclease of predicted toxin-antitoxin system
MSSSPAFPRGFQFLKLLVDENLAPDLAERLADLFPGSVHVGSVGLGSMPDEVIWDYARANQFTFLTKDKDFANLSLALGPPPKVAGKRGTVRLRRLIFVAEIRLSEIEMRYKIGLLVLR